MKSNFVSLHPYFNVHPGKLEAFRAALPAFVEKTATEEKNLFYGFTINGDEIFCREGYTDAEGVLAHLDNIGALLAEALKIADLIRVELHGPAKELDKLKGPLAHLNPAWFALEASLPVESRRQNGANGMSHIEGKAARVEASVLGQ